jgi:periplasmic protein TonB
MFNNLIESSSHAKEFKRRGSFLLFTTATYVVLFVITGVISIYAYDAHLESQSTEWEIVTLAPLPEAEAPAARPDPLRPSAPSDPGATRSIRTVLMDSTSNPNNPPPTVGTIASDVPPATRYSEIGLTNVEPPVPASVNRGVAGGTGSRPVIDIPDTPPPPAPNPTPVVPKLLRISRVLNSEAISLPKPIYPPIAKQTRTQGIVTVQILINETGKVISAKAVAGHAFLIPEAQRAAMQARFSPTLIGDQPVKVSGVITYRFEMQ